MDDIEEEAQRAALLSFGDIIRRKRQAPQWTTKDLAEKTGIEITDLNHAENGWHCLPDVEREILCRFLGIDLDTYPKILRNERIKAARNGAASAEQVRAAHVVDLTRYRETWQKTTTHPED